MTDITECMTELPDYACSEIGGVDRESIRKRPVYGVLGNHDTIRMVPDLEAMGIRMLLNECEPIEREAATIYLAGIDDAHFYRVDNIEKAGSRIPHDVFSILLSHTPEIYRQAAYAGFDLLLSGHTHGGQICLPGSIPLTLGRFCHVASERAHGHIITWPDTRRPALGRQSCPCALTACRKSLCTACGVSRNAVISRGGRVIAARKRDERVVVRPQKRLRNPLRYRLRLRTAGVGKRAGEKAIPEADRVQLPCCWARGRAADQKAREQIADHRGGRYQQSNPEGKAEQYRSQCGYHQRDDNPANSFGGTDQRPSIDKSGIAVHGSCVIRTEDTLCNNGRAIRQRKQDQNLRERYIVHSPMSPDDYLPCNFGKLQNLLQCIRGAPPDSWQ